MRKIQRSVVFDLDIAHQVGINAAIVFGRIEWAVAKNEEAKDQMFFRDEVWWTCCTHAEFESYSSLSSKQIRKAIQTLLEVSLIWSSQSLNAIKSDRRTWYCVSKPVPKGHLDLYSYNDMQSHTHNQKNNHTHNQTRAYAGQEEGGGACGFDSSPAVGRPEGIEAEAGAGICSKTNGKALSTALDYETLVQVLFEYYKAPNQEDDAWGSEDYRKLRYGGYLSEARNISDTLIAAGKDWTLYQPNAYKSTNPTNVLLDIYMYLDKKYLNAKSLISGLLEFVREDKFWQPRIRCLGDLMKTSSSGVNLFFVDQIVMRMTPSGVLRNGGNNKSDCAGGPNISEI